MVEREARSRMGKNISTSGTGSQSIGVSRQAVTRIHPNEAQGTAGCDMQSDGAVEHAFRHMIEWSAPGLGQEAQGFGSGFQKH